MRAAIVIAPLALLLTGGCVAKTALSVVTAPVKATAQVADWATTSQDEADRARGREIRAQEERLGKLQRDLAKQEQKCLGGNDRSCREAVEARQEIAAIMPTVPAEPVRD